MDPNKKSGPRQARTEEMQGLTAVHGDLLGLAGA